MVHPFLAAHSAESIRDLIVIELTTQDGESGWGECPTLGDGDYFVTTPTVWQWLSTQGAATSDGRSDSRIPLRGALSDAATALAVQRSGLDSSALGLAHSVHTTTVLGAESRVEVLEERVAQALAGGATTIKLKCSDGNLAPLATVRARFPDVAVAVDANQSLAPPESAAQWRQLLDRIAAMNLLYLEEPMRDPRGVNTLVEAEVTRVVFDESLPHDTDVLVRHFGRLSAKGAVGANLKPVRLGGWAEGASVAEQLTSLDVACFVGGMLETGIGRRSAARLAARLASTAGPSLPTDIGPTDRYLTVDLLPPLQMEGSHLLTSTIFGLDDLIDQSALDRLTVDRCTGRLSDLLEPLAA
jgi:O-succinylbenzoate synthase